MSLDQGSVTLYKKISNMPSNKAPALGVMNPLGSRIAQVDGFNEGVFFAGVKPPAPQKVELYSKKEYKKDAKIGLKGQDLPKKFSLATGLLYEASGEQATGRISQITGANRALRMFNNPTMAEYILGRKLTPEEIMRKSVSGPMEIQLEPPKRTLPAQDILNLKKFLDQNLDLLSGGMPVEEEKKSSSDSQPSEVVMTKEVDVPSETYNEVAKYEGEAIDFVQYRQKIMNATTRDELQALAEEMERVLGTTISEKADDFISNNREFIVDYMNKPVEQQQAFKKLLRDVGLDIATARRILTLDSDFTEAINRITISKASPATAVSAQPPIKSRSGKDEEPGPPADEPPPPPMQKGRPTLPPEYVATQGSSEFPQSTGYLMNLIFNKKSSKKGSEARKSYSKQIVEFFRENIPEKDFKKLKGTLESDTDEGTYIAWATYYGMLEDVDESLEPQDLEEIKKRLKTKIGPTVRKWKRDESSSSSGAGMDPRKKRPTMFLASKEAPEKDVEFAKDRLKILVGSLEAKNRPNKRLVDEAGQLVQYLLLHKAIPKKLAVSIMNKVVNLNTK